MKSYEHLLRLWISTEGYWHRELKFKNMALYFGYSQRAIEIFMIN